MVGKISSPKPPSIEVLSMLSYTELKEKPKVLLSFTGLTQTEFETLLAVFRKSGDDRKKSAMPQRNVSAVPGAVVRRS